VSTNRQLYIAVCLGDFLQSLNIDTSELSCRYSRLVFRSLLHLSRTFHTLYNMSNLAHSVGYATCPNSASPVPSTSHMNANASVPSLEPTLLMPSIDLDSPSLTRRSPSVYSTPMLDGPWTESPSSFFSSPASRVKSCSPYGSPSNPFRYRGARFSPFSPQRAATSTASRGGVYLHRAIQNLTASHLINIPSFHAASPERSRSGWKEHENRDALFVDPRGVSGGNVWESIFRVVFWAAVVVLFSALMGVGADKIPLEDMTTRAWSEHIPAASGMGWKGVGMVDLAGGLVGMEIGRGIEGIWDTERVS